MAKSMLDGRAVEEEELQEEESHFVRYREALKQQAKGNLDHALALYQSLMRSKLVSQKIGFLFE